MSAQDQILGLVDARREVAGAPRIGVELLHEGAMGGAHGRGLRARLKPKDLIGFLFGHRATRSRAALPRTRISLSVFTPGGRPAVEISFE